MRFLPPTRIRLERAFAFHDVLCEMSGPVVPGRTSNTSREAQTRQIDAAEFLRCVTVASRSKRPRPAMNESCSVSPPRFQQSVENTVEKPIHQAYLNNKPLVLLAFLRGEGQRSAIFQCFSRHGNVILP
jgi:hypothetical protein